MTKDAASADGPAQDIAIVGMSCMFPCADNPRRFWQNVVHKVDCVTDAPSDWNPDFFYDPSLSAIDRSYTMKGGFLGDLCRFNPVKYGVPPANIEGAEPDQFIALRCAYEALADAGIPKLPLNRQKTAVIFGRGIFVNRGWVTAVQRSVSVEQLVQVLRQLEPHRTEAEFDLIRQELRKSLPPWNADTFPGLVHSALAGRIANRFDLMGPSYNVDAACSSTLIAVEHGIRELRAGRCDAVLAGGSQVSTPGPIHVMFCHLQALSQTGKIAPFSAQANGTLLGQGCGLVVLKRRADAERDGNRIYAIIKAIGVSSDGRGAGLLAPRSEGQQLAIKRAYDDARISPDSVALVEAHGTGIPLGDATEIESLCAGFGPQINNAPDVALGSVKSMVGHLLPASGVPALIKTALALYHKVLPPTLHADSEQQNLNFSKTRFYLSNETRPWLHHRTDVPRRAGINAFGFGGINAHALLEESPHDELCATVLEQDWPCETVVIAAASRQALTERIASFSTWLRGFSDGSLLDIAYSCAVTNLGNSRLAIVAKDIPDLIKKLDQSAKLLAQPDRQRIHDRSGIFWQAEPFAQQHRVGFMFPGEGGQYVNMLGELCRHFPEVRQEFEVTAGALAARGRPFAQLLYCQPSASRHAETELFRMETAVAAVTAATRGLWRLLDRLQVKADAMVGHSSGEYAALLASGACGDLDSARLRDITTAGIDSACELDQSQLVPSALLVSAGGVPDEELQLALAASQGQVEIAMDNCPNQRILVGAEPAMNHVLGQLQGKGGLCQRLPWGRPYHTAAFKPACEIVGKYIDSLKLQTPNVQLWSCATAAPFPKEATDVRELAIRQWYSPVRFRETIHAMYDAGVRVFVDVGPRGNLAAFVTDTLGDKPHVVVALAAPNKSDLLQLCNAVGQLAASGIPVKLEELYSRRSPKKIDLSAPPMAARPQEQVLRTDLPEMSLPQEFAEQWHASSVNQRPHDSDTVTPVGKTAVANVSQLAKIPPKVSVTAKLLSLEEDSPHITTVADEISVSEFQEAYYFDSDATEFEVLEIDHAKSHTAITADVISDDPRIRAVQEFQTTMQQFLRTQEAVTSVYAQHRSRSHFGSNAASTELLQYDSAVEVNYDESTIVDDMAVDVAPVEIDRAPFRPRAVTQPTSKREFPSNRATGEAPRHLATVAAPSKDLIKPQPKSWPFIETVLDFRPGERIVAEVEISLAKHPFLADHTFFGRNVSRAHPELHSLPIMPMAMTFELMAEGAMMLFPDATVSALTDIRAMRWLACPKHSRRVRVEATAVHDQQVRATVYLADVDGNEEVASGYVELMSRPKTLGDPILPDEQQGPPPWSPQNLYNYLIYHGPSFQGLKDFEDFGPKGLRANVRQPGVRLLRDWPDSALALPVALIDTASQVAGMFIGNHNRVGKFTKVAFPNTIERLEVSDAAWNDVPMIATATFDQSTDKLVSDTEIRSRDGKVVMRYLGRTEEIALLPLELYLYGLVPTTRLATPLTSLFSGVPGIDKCQLCEVTGAGDKLLVKSVWAQVLASLVLSPAERQIMEQLRLPPVKLVSWLLKRVAVKEAIGQLADPELRLADIDVPQQPSNGGLVSIPGQATFLTRVADDLFFVTALAAPANSFRAVGLSVQPIRSVDESWIAENFTTAGQAKLATMANASEMSPDVFWRAVRGAQDAFSQALSLTTADQMRQVEFVECDFIAQSFTLTLQESNVATSRTDSSSQTSARTNEMDSKDSVGLTRSPAAVKVHWRKCQEHILALCLILHDD